MPRRAAAVIVIDALGEGAGFATGTMALVIISFALLFASPAGSRVLAGPVLAWA